MINATKQAWSYAEQIASTHNTTAFVIMKQCEKIAKKDALKYGGDSIVRKETVRMWEYQQ